MPEPTSSTRRAKLLLATGASLLALLAGEVFCRVRAHLHNQSSMQVAFSTRRHLEQGQRVALIDMIQMSQDPKIVFELKPGLQAVPFKSVPVSTNRFGFRGPEIDVEPGPDTVTILGLGDSIMFGWGVGDGTYYMAILERMLNQKYPQKHWRVIDTAVPAYNTVMEVETLRVKGLQFKPDVVILNIVPNDLVLPQYVRIVDNVFDLKRSFLYELVRDGLGSGLGRNGFEALEGRDTRLAHASMKDLQGDDVPEEYRQLVGFDPFVGALKELHQMSQDHGFAVVTFSTVEDATETKMLQAAAKEGFPHVALLPEIQAWMDAHGNGEFSAEHPDGYMHSALVVSTSDGHPSVLQHRMAAEKLLGALEDDGCIAKLLK